MRLSYQEAMAIVETFREIFGAGSIYLFGSRADDTRRGGDIDLYAVPENRENLTDKKYAFLLALKNRIGDQKIDLIIAQDPKRPIEQEALRKGIIMDETRLRIRKYLDQCRKHKLRIEKASSKIRDIFPLSAPRYERLSDEEVEAIDQYLFRFAKLQDTLGSKLFRLIVSEYEEDIERMTLQDILHRLEKIGILEKAEIWQQLKAVRNEIAHQYDDIPEESAEALNCVFAYREELIRIFDRIEAYYHRKGIL